jgi:hypothetical protein
MQPDYQDLSVEDELRIPLPPGWSGEVGPDGVGLYVHDSGYESLEHPFLYQASQMAREFDLPAEWTVKEVELSDGSVDYFYSNLSLKISMWDHPYLKQCLGIKLCEAGIDPAEIGLEQPPSQLQSQSQSPQSQQQSHSQQQSPQSQSQQQSHSQQQSPQSQQQSPDSYYSKQQQLYQQQQQQHQQHNQQQQHQQHNQQQQHQQQYDQQQHQHVQQQQQQYSEETKQAQPFFYQDLANDDASGRITQDSVAGGASLSMGDDDAYSALDDEPPLPAAGGTRNEYEGRYVSANQYSDWGMALKVGLRAI